MAKDTSVKAADGKLDTDDTTKLNTEKSVQDQPTDDVKRVKPDVKIDPLTTNVEIPVQRIKHMPGGMTVITTSAGQLIVPVGAFINETQPAELAPDEKDANGNDVEPGDSTVTVNASYARSQGLI